MVMHRASRWPADNRSRAVCRLTSKLAAQSPSPGEVVKVTAKVLLTAVLLLAPAVSASAQEWARKMFEATSHDFGAVARGAKVEYRFKLSNIYEEEVHISGVHSSCGCTSPQISKDSLKTYEEGAIVAVFNTRSFTGQKHATVTVNIDRPFPAEVQLQVSGYIRSDIVVYPGEAEFGSIDQGSGAEKKLEVNYAGRNDWKIVQVKSGNPHLVASVAETQRGNGNVSYQLQVRLKPDAPVGYFKDQITLVTNDSRSTEVPVEVEARIIAEVTLSPSSLFLGVVKPGQKVTKQLVVQAKKPFKIKAVHCDDPSFEAKIDDASKTVHVVPITFTAGDKSAKIERKIRIETDLGADVSSELKAYAQILAETDKAAKK
jgi:hypothetical protein